MTETPHTLDNLCKNEREKVFEMLKQLNEYKKRCASLEQELIKMKLENNRLSGQIETLTYQLDSTQNKLYEYIDLSKDSQTQIEQLSIKLQKIETERKSLNNRYQDSQTECITLRDSLLQMRQKHEHPLVSTSTNFKPYTCEKYTNTDDKTVFFKDETTQVSFLHSNVFSNQTETVDLQSQTPLSISDEGIQTTTDNELAYVISILNQY